jgi:alkylation response protein AidB-like acyl-CoA dehydrogenase
MDHHSASQSTTSEALAAAGDADAARDIGALDAAAGAVERKLAPVRRSLVERLIYGPPPNAAELQAGGRIAADLERERHPALAAALDVLDRGQAFAADGKISAQLREAMAAAGAYGLTVPTEFGGRGENYLQLAGLEEALSANGLGPMAVEVSGQLTIGAGSLLAYGSGEQQRTFLPMVAEGTLMAFALTEVGTGVNAKKIEAFVEKQPDGSYRLFAEGRRNKLWITNARHGGIAGIVARVGRNGDELGLFLVRFPERDIDAAEGYEFRLAPSGVAAFTANENARLHFSNFPIPAANRVPGEGVEVLFYSLRLGRCMLAAMSAGYQRMLARDASHYARARPGVGGLVIKHELPQLAIGRMLGGSLQARALAFLALSQDADGADLAGLRDITKSSAAQTGLESMIAAEHVLGGRAFDGRSRVNAARVNLHLFGVVEGEDEMIRMGMVRDVTGAFVARHLAPLLGQLKKANTAPNGQPVPAEQLILRLGLGALLRHPERSRRALVGILHNAVFYRLAGWITANAGADLLRLPLRLVPTSALPRYRALPASLRAHARYAERELRRIRWTYLRLSLTFQLELTGAQIALQRLGQRIEWLVSMLALCHHAAPQDETQWRIADLQCVLLRERIEAAKAGLRGRALRRLRRAIAAVGQDVADDRTSLFARLEPEPFAHPFDEDGR